MQSIIQSVCHSDAVDNFFPYGHGTICQYVGVNNAIFMAAKKFFDINWRKLTS